MPEEIALNYLATGNDSTELGRPKFLSDQKYIIRFSSVVCIAAVGDDRQTGPQSSNGLIAPSNNNLTFIKEANDDANRGARSNYLNNDNVISDRQVANVALSGPLVEIGALRFDISLSKCSCTSSATFSV